ncbi:hypothetical protein DSUL_50019 [Desulfovibrionales bacterium]
MGYCNIYSDNTYHTHPLMVMMFALFFVAFLSVRLLFDKPIMNT